MKKIKEPEARLGIIYAKIKGAHNSTHKCAPEQRMCRKRTNRFRTAVSVEKEGGGQGRNYSIESSWGTPGLVVWSRSFRVRCGTGVATFSRARMGARVPVDGVMKIQNTVKERGRKKSK